MKLANLKQLSLGEGSQKNLRNFDNGKNLKASFSKDELVGSSTFESKNIFDTYNGNRWLIYQSERFPILQYAPLVAAFSASGLALSYMTLGSTIPPTFKMFITAFVVSFLTFVQLRVSDEIKDQEFDQKYHPDRPVPRGLVSLKELTSIGCAAAAIQLVFAVSLSPLLMLPLIATWSYLYLMHNEFFIGEWLNKHQIAYMLSHMGILFFTDLFITSCHWLVVSNEPSQALLFFFGTSFKLGMVIEIGRKIKAPQDEVQGANTYSRSWGANKAALVWLLTVFASGVFAILTAHQVGFGQQALICTIALFIICAKTTANFINNKTTRTAKKIESVSGIWTLSIYLLVGVAPFIYALIF